MTTEALPVATSQVPALLIVVPLMAAPLVILLRKWPTLCWALTTLVCGGCAIYAFKLLLWVRADGPINYFMGNWPAPWGIELRVDLLSALVLVLVAGIGFIVSVYAKASVEKEFKQEKQPLFYTLFLLCLAGLLGITISGDAFNVFVFLEISSLATYALIAMGPDRRALTAAFRYLILGTIGATFYVIGIGFLYAATGTLNMTDLAGRLPDMADQRSVITGIAFIAIGLAMKAAVFPMHKWLPPAYTYAPSVISTFLAATATKVALYAFIRMFLTVLGPIEAFQSQGGFFSPAELLAVLAFAGMFSASISAIFQYNAKRLLAYSSIGQVGYMLLGLSFFSVIGLSATIVHLFNHGVMKAALFMALGCVFYRIGSVRIRDMAGLGKTMPLTMAAFVTAGLSLIGVPATAGFVGKWQLVLASFEHGWWWAALLIGLASLLAVIYVWKVVEAAYFTVPADDAPSRTATEAPLFMLIPLLIMAVANIYFGLQTDLSLGTAQEAAAYLLDPSHGVLDPATLPAIDYKPGGSTAIL
ncbi:MAG: monovalent cation/H+ antiporter subunit D family protein, partial [Rhodospirillaceae bacterium]